MNEHTYGRSAVVHEVPYPNNYSREMLTFARGKGAYLYDGSGKKYLDLGSGIAVNALGYGRRDLARVAARQMRRLIHVSNLYATEPALRLARRLIDGAAAVMRERPTAVHFGNSGSEANESALKYARLYALRSRGTGNHKLLCFENGFHGRTLGALSVTPSPKYRDPFTPLLSDVTVLPYNDPVTLERELSSEYAALIVEVIQGEGGLHTMTPAFAEALNRLCAEHDVLLILDEVQTGIGRTGTFYAAEQLGLLPDILTLSKPLAAGLPLSATLIPERINTLVKLGEHGSTFGGGPVTTAVAEAVLNVVERSGLLENVSRQSAHLDRLLHRLQEDRRTVASLRGLGLLRGVELGLDSELAAEIMPRLLEQTREAGVLILRSGTNVIRIAPPLTISTTELENGIAVLGRELQQLETEISYAMKGRK